ncbi:MAG: hypothetical protein HQ536_00125 [Parcubacteria group bacterium]|nr:hypothetical protein [Parcubacteria group bacterium]
MSKIFLIARPNHDTTTRYLSAWSEKIIELANKKGIQILDLKKDKANVKELESRISKMQPLFIVFNGHGSSDCITGHDNKDLIRVGDNEELLDGKMIYTVSCKSAMQLGPKSIKAGALSYIGYIEDFVFFYDYSKLAHPLEDKIAKLFLEPSNQVAISLIKGNTAGEASRRSKEFSKRNIQKLLTSESSGDKESIQRAQFLWWNMESQVCLGDKNSKF